MVGTLVVCASAGVAGASVALFPLRQVRLLDGPFKVQQDVDLRYMMAHDPDRFLAPMRHEAGLPAKAQGYGNWEAQGLGGQTAGHYLSALAMMYASTGDAEAKRRMDYMIAELAACQAANGDGYVGGVPNGKQLWAELAQGKMKVGGFDLNDRWVPWYNVHKTFAGVRDAYVIGGNEQAKAVLVGMADWCAGLLGKLSDEQLQRMMRAEHGGMNEVLADVSAITGDAKYLALARRFSDQAILKPLEQGRDDLTGKHANTQIPKVIGFERIGTLADDAPFRTAALRFWENVTAKRSVAIGGNSTDEHFHPVDNFTSMREQRTGPETCNTYNMLRLTEQLFTADPQGRFADYYERALFNHILSSQNPTRGGFVYFTPMRARHYRVYSQAEQAFWCCVGTGFENHAKYGTFIYAHDADRALLVNLFMPSELKWAERGVTVRQETTFPDQPSTRLTLSMSSPSAFALRVRKPSWVSGNALTVAVNGKSSSLTADASGYVSVDRTWADGDRVEVTLPMHVTAEGLPDGSPYVAFLYGPVVLAAATGTEQTPGTFAGDGRGDHISSGPLLPLNDAAMLLVDEPKRIAERVQPVAGKPLTFSLGQAVQPESARGLTLTPFARLHETRYQIYFHTVTPAAYAAERERIDAAEKQRLALERRTVDVVTPGQQQSEVDHRVRHEESQTGVHRDRSWRDARGWFSYELKPVDDPKAKLELLVTYFGRDRDRAFSVSLNGVKLADVSLDGTGGDDFFEARYPVDVPREAGKPFTLRFDAKPGSVAGGVYEARLVKVEKPAATQPSDGAARRATSQAEQGWRDAGVPAPILDGFTADPAIRVFGDTYYVYPTSDKPNWDTTDFSVWSSKNLVDWKREGMILDVTKDLSWAKLRAWAPDCVQGPDGRFYFYFCADTKIGVGVADTPVGPFKDALDRPLVKKGGKVNVGQTIDPAAFIDDDGQAYLYYGNGDHAQVFKLKPNMIETDGDPVDIRLREFREGIVVFKRGGKYYFMWSIDDARSPTYRVGWGTSDSPLGPVTPAKQDFIALQKHGAAVATAHHSVVNVPGTDRWYVAYHRHAVPDGSGFKREVCLARMEFDAQGNIRPMDPLVAPFKPGDAGEPIGNDGKGSR